MINVSTIGDLRNAVNNALSVYPDDYQIIGNYQDEKGNWYTSPVYIAKVPGDNHIIAIQCLPLKNQGENDERSVATVAE